MDVLDCIYIDVYIPSTCQLHYCLIIYTRYVGLFDYFSLALTIFFASVAYQQRNICLNNGNFIRFVWEL